MILEPAVSLTDYGIAIEGVTLAALLCRKPKSAVRLWFVLFFAFIAVAAAIGGTVHGFVPDESTVAYAVLWRATLIVIGLVAVAATMAAATSGWGTMLKRVVATISASGFAIYCMSVLFITQQYLAAIVVYLPATVFLLISFIAAYVRTSSDALARKPFLVGAGGMLLTFVAAGVQQSKITIGGLDHNAIYHVFQVIALAMIYSGGVAFAKYGPVHR